MLHDDQNWSAVVRPSSHHQHKHFCTTCLGEKGRPSAGKMLAWSIMGFGYHPGWAPLLHWSGSGIFPFRLWRCGIPHSLSQSPATGPQLAIPRLPISWWDLLIYMRSPLVTNLQGCYHKNTWPSGVQVLPFSQCLHGEDALLRLGNVVPAAWRATLKEKKQTVGWIQSHLPSGKEW